MDGVDLNSAWRSAECVTSLYDRVRELELRNAELEAEVMQWRDQSRQNRITDANTSVDLARAIRERDEWRDRFKQQDDISRRLQKCVDAMKEEHKEQVAKLQERCQFDPHGPKRVQVCVASLQKTLDSRVQEYESMQQRLRDTLDANAKMVNTNAALVEERTSLLQTISLQNAHRMFTLFQRRQKDALIASWTTWCFNTIRNIERQKREDSFQRLAALASRSKKQLLQRQASRFSMQREKANRLRTFKAWACHVHAIRQTRHVALELFNASRRRNLVDAFELWREQAARRASCSRVLQRLVRNHKHRHILQGYRQWVQATRTLLIETIILKCDVIEAEKSNAVAELDRLQAELSASRATERAWEQTARDLELQQATTVARHSNIVYQWTASLAMCYERMVHRRRQNIVFQAWKSKIQIRQTLRRLSARWQAQRIRAVVVQWRHYRHDRPRAMRMTMQYMRCRRNGRWQRDAFGAWARLAHHMATRRRKLHRFRHVQDLASHQCYWKQWRSYVLIRTEYKRHLGNVLDALNNMLRQHVLRHALKSWQSKVVAIVQRDLRLQWVVEAAVGQSRTQLLCHVMARWKRHAAVHKKRNVWLAFKTRQRRDRFQGWTHAVWRAWFAQCAVQIHRRFKLAAVVMRWQSRWMRHGLWRWAANGRIASFRESHTQTVTELNKSILALHESMKSDAEQHRLDIEGMEATMRATEEAFQKNLLCQGNEWSQQREQLERDLHRMMLLKDASDEAAAQLKCHLIMSQRRGEALEGALMEGEAQWLRHVEVHRLDQRHRDMLEEDARSALCRLETTMSRWRAAWDAEKRALGKKLEELTKSHDEIKAKMGAKALECLMQRTTVFCFNRWKAFVATARETKGKVSHIVALLQSNKTALVFHRWKQHHELQQAQKQLTAKWHQIHATTLVKSAFNAWAASVAENRKLSSILELFGLTSARKTYESVWRQWCHRTCRRRDGKRLWTRALDHITKQVYKVGMQQWKAVADAISLAKRAQFKIQALDHATNAVQRKWNNIVCRQVIVWWRENAHANRRERDLLKRCALRLQHFAVGRVFEAWRENAWLQRRDRDARDIVLALCLRHVLSSTWARWRQFRLASAAVERRQLEEAHRITQQALQDAKSTIESLTSQFQSTKAHASSLQDTTKQLKMQLQASKCMQFFQSTVRSAFFEWKRVAKLLQQTKGRVLVIVRRMQRMHHALVLDKWKAFVTTRHVKAHRAAAAQALHRKFIQLHTLHAWMAGIRRRIELRQKCQWIAHMMANTSIRCVWNEWRRFQQHQRHACNALVAITTALEVSEMRRLWQRWCDHHKAFIFHDEAQRKKAQQLLEFLSARASTSLRWYLDGWKQFLKRRRKKGTHDVLCKRWICQNVWRRWHHAIHQDRQLLRVLHQYERRILRKGWVQWQLGLVKLEIAWTKHTMEMERIQQHEQWEIERAQLTSTSVELEKQVQQHQSTIIAKDMTLEVFQTNIATMEAMHRESEACRSLYEDKFTTALHKLFETMSLQRIVRCVWVAWTKLRHGRRLRRTRAIEWLRSKQVAMMELVVSTWKARLVPHRRRLRLQLKFRRRRVEGAVERWRLRTLSRLQLKAAMRTVVLNLTRRRSQRLTLAWRQWQMHTMVAIERAKQLSLEETYRRESAQEKTMLASTQVTLTFCAFLSG
ncbi:hypothetical protein H310_00356 [Aphanomyces invadans]|uniref:Sfi1 spindle body domain-containing protein n=1 Tax=Aphanomyces invadans TaxID=157072 RepID=A0A024UWC8_9STRA|nr:hypothetical protein H310_00356 [Aphanomyces invadans]ETW09928.1 hypothetical protein H310_00356 [Aphanomyces invadans]|eukprot:XP_008861339.1 hypothetical protein H310_00356 [Aphanomyces invadans]